MQITKSQTFFLQDIKGQPNNTEADANCQKTVQKNSKSSKISKQKNKQSRGQWSLIEEMEYVRFLKNYRKTLKKQTGNRKTRVYKKMSEFICTRTNTQCTSHHQKMMEKYGCIQTIISAIKQICFLKQLQCQMLQDLQNKEKRIKSSPAIEKNSLQNMLFGPQQATLLIRELQSAQQQYWTSKQELYAQRSLNEQLKNEQQIQNQQERRKRKQSQQWKLYLNLN